MKQIHYSKSSIKPGVKCQGDGYTKNTKFEILEYL